MRSASVGLLATIVVASSCVSVKAVVLDRRTQLENQLLGRFAALERQLILASSVRGESPPRAQDKALSPLQRELVEAQMNRAFNADDVEALKDAKVVGEGRRGLLVLAVLPTEVARAKHARQLMAAENRDRKTIFRGLIATSAELSERDLPLLQRIFFELRARTARRGELVENKRGELVAAKATEMDRATETDRATTTDRAKQEQR
ncbi:MAG: DUF1318 domain-containing protein [Deltaproteobacteria bacterium]|nr:DUF1318 domain-containing protein [Deltaproteobacteria bacterium]